MSQEPSIGRIRAVAPNRSWGRPRDVYEALTSLWTRLNAVADVINCAASATVVYFMVTSCAVVRYSEAIRIYTRCLTKTGQLEVQETNTELCGNVTMTGLFRYKVEVSGECRIESIL
jgi:hypothetical protein